MELLIQTALSFPAVILVALLSLMAIYWLLVAIGLAPIEFLEHDSLREDHLASALVSLGFAGVPVSVALTLLLGFGTLAAMAIELLVLRFLPLGMLRLPLGLVVLWGALALAAPLSVALCRKLQPRLHRFRSACQCSLLGESVIVKAEGQEGDLYRATLEEDPAVEVVLHAKRGAIPSPGERWVLVKYLADEQAYRAVPRSKYLDARTRLRRLRTLQRHGKHAMH
ncbi:hypothetical protein GCM10007160_19130 [Litchfieldella qijiaojingensis]|uniref:DUF1449 family protein n=1 Tax=Litchfieldella qijiaojingensis TaxID=980347 RepID=A0ABQ2YT47_9GAMM|nr:hypothetical protein [Halomonas qijiaojingensis]GGX91806.1 hypothetical protein GCM10007160_19130 [Halomonas qijiaojingensis]